MFAALIIFPSSGSSLKLKNIVVDTIDPLIYV